MILIGLGSNLPHKVFGPSVRVLEMAVSILSTSVEVIKLSDWYRSPPFDSLSHRLRSGPCYVNGVIRVDTALTPKQLLNFILFIEKSLGRDRASSINRVVDLDLISYDNLVMNDKDLILPHPRMSERSFVLFPLRDVHPQWRHPVSQVTLSELIEKLPHEMAEKTQRYN